MIEQIKVVLINKVREIKETSYPNMKHQLLSELIRYIKDMKEEDFKRRRL